MDCRLARGRVIDAFRGSLVGAHERLCGMAQRVPSVCADLLKLLPKQRSARRDEPIIAVSELLGALDIDPLALRSSCMPICT